MSDGRVTVSTGSGTPAADGRPCPICGKPAVAEAEPFCSKRCADVDLHRWLSGRYAIPTDESDGPEGLADDEG